MHASRAVAGYVEQVSDMSGEQKKELLDQAHAYNQQLNTLPDRWAPPPPIPVRSRRAA